MGLVRASGSGGTSTPGGRVTPASVTVVAVLLAAAPPAAAAHAGVPWGVSVARPLTAEAPRPAPAPAPGLDRPGWDSTDAANWEAGPVLACARRAAAAARASRADFATSRHAACTHARARAGRPWRSLRKAASTSSRDACKLSADSSEPTAGGAPPEAWFRGTCCHCSPLGPRAARAGDAGLRETRSTPALRGWLGPAARLAASTPRRPEETDCRWPRAASPRLTARDAAGWPLMAAEARTCASGRSSSLLGAAPALLGASAARRAAGSERRPFSEASAREAEQVRPESGPQLGQPSRVSCGPPGRDPLAATTDRLVAQ